MFSGSFERLLSAARAKDVNAGDGFNMPSAFNEALQNENAAYLKTLQAGADGAGRVTADFGTGAYNNPMLNQSIPGMNIGNELGVVTAQGQGNFNIMNPFTYGNMNKAVEGTRAGDENIQYSDSPAGQVGEAANERNRLLKQLLEGS